MVASMFIKINKTVLNCRGSLSAKRGERGLRCTSEVIPTILKIFSQGRSTFVDVTPVDIVDITKVDLVLS